MQENISTTEPNVKQQQIKLIVVFVKNTTRLQPPPMIYQTVIVRK